MTEFHLNIRRQELIEVRFTDEYVFIAGHNISAPGLDHPKDSFAEAGEEQQRRKTENDQKGDEGLHFANIIAKIKYSVHLVMNLKVFWYSASFTYLFLMSNAEIGFGILFFLSLQPSCTFL